jgi:hypothetical protein
MRSRHVLNYAGRVVGECVHAVRGRHVLEHGGRVVGVFMHAVLGRFVLEYAGGDFIEHLHVLRGRHVLEHDGCDSVHAVPVRPVVEHWCDVVPVVVFVQLLVVLLDVHGAGELRMVPVVRVVSGRHIIRAHCRSLRKLGLVKLELWWR